MERTDAIRSAYRLTGSNSFYDGMITCSTLPGKIVCRLVWAMNKDDCDSYQSKAFSGIPEDFSGRLLEVPVGTGVLTFPDGSFDLVLSLNGFHAFPDKEAAYRETFRVLKPGGTFCGCFYVQGEHPRTDRLIRRVYQPMHFFTPPYETVTSLTDRLKSMYAQAEVGNVKSIAWFVCRKAEKEDL